MANIELPKDAEGREIPLDTKALYDANGDTREVQAFEFSVIDGMWRVQFLGNFIYFYTNDMHLTPPDSWENLFEDLDRCIEADCISHGTSLVLEDIKQCIRKLAAKED